MVVFVSCHTGRTPLGKEARMPLKTIRISSKSGEVIPDGTGARVRVMFYDDSRPDQRADLSDEEVAEILLPFTEEVE